MRFGVESLWLKFIDLAAIDCEILYYEKVVITSERLIYLNIT